MTIAIIIPAKNEEEVIPLLLQSIAEQTVMPDEVILVNSHSSDATVERAMTFTDKLPLKIYDAKVRGVAAARNEGVAQANADYLLFIDSDIILPPECIEKLKQAIETRHLDIGGFRQKMNSKHFGLRLGAQLMNVYVRLMSVTPWPIFFSCFFIKRSLHERIDGFDPAIYIMEDYDYALRGRRAGGKFGIVGGTYFGASPRRYEAEHGKRSIVNGFYGEFYRYTHGMRITKPIYEYKMGGKEKSDKK
jgi:glycosyltransferase involved in cell wall biosynthesis